MSSGSRLLRVPSNSLVPLVSRSTTMARTPADLPARSVSLDAHHWPLRGPGLDRTSLGILVWLLVHSGCKAPRSWLIQVQPQSGLTLQDLERLPFSTPQG